jgi:tRNA(Ile)-lysidine synthase
MDISIAPGRYVVAVSGGVDSMALLHLLQGREGLRLTVAHFDHGIRPDSREDRLLVQHVASTYGVPFVFAEGQLGQGTSEDVARIERYRFLHKVRSAAGADSLVTAHHKDDVLETAVINLVRGTGRKGLSSLKATDIVKRPLLHVHKDELMEYARTHDLQWREDSTNIDPAYLRNHIRHNVLGRLPEANKQKLHRTVAAMHELNAEIDTLLENYLQSTHRPDMLDRQSFILLPHIVAREVMAAWLRDQGIRDFDKKMLERLVHAAKIHKVGSRTPINNRVNLRVDLENLALEHAER